MTSPNQAARASVGVRIAGSGSAVPEKALTNDDLEQLMDTSSEWIVQRTGVRERRISDRDKGETTTRFAHDSLKRALDDAGLEGKDLDLVICATMTPEMPTPAVACRVAAELGTNNVGAYDVNAACSGFVFSVNTAAALIQSGPYRRIGVIGVDTLSSMLEFTTRGRGTAIIFGDGAGAVVLERTDDTSKGVLAQAMRSDGHGWKEIYVPRCESDFPTPDEFEPHKIGKVQMAGRSVFKFAVGTFPDLIQETLDQAGLEPGDVDHYVCHQSNARILTAARDRFGLPEEKLYINIDRYGNTVAGSVPLCLDELRKAGRIKEGQRIMMVGFGAGLTWGSSLWQL